MEQETRNFINVWITILTSLCYCYYIPSKLPKGNLRLLPLIPVCTLFTILPLFLSSIISIGITAFFITWLANFKLILFALDKGPLYSNPPYSLFHFILLACLPITTIKQIRPYPNPKNSPTSTPTLAIVIPIKSFLFGILLFLLDLNYSKDAFIDGTIEMHTIFVLGLYTAMFYIYLDIILVVPYYLGRWILGIELEAPLNKPLLCTSLQDFWGRRWDLAVRNLLWQTIYKPLTVFLESKWGIKWARYPAIQATFLVSGLMHELIFYYMTHVAPTWEITLFFVLHGACTVVELRVKVALGERWQLHRVVSGPLTLAFIEATLLWLFYLPLMNSGVDVRAVRECKILLEFFKLK